MTHLPDRIPTIAELVNQLFDQRRHPSGREYSNREVGLALQRKNPGAHIAKLRNGRIQNPTRETLLVLARFFHIQPLYFFPELTHEGVTFEPFPSDQAGREKNPA